MKFETDDIGKQHVHGLTEHDSLGFDTAHAPTHHAKTIDHGGMRVGADQGIGE